MSNIIRDYEDICRKTNNQKVNKLEKSKEELLDKVVDHYSKHMKQLLDDHPFLSKDNFKAAESVVRSKTESKFKKEIDFGNHSMNEHFFLKCVQKMKESKVVFKEMNSKKSEEINQKNKIIYEKSIRQYNTEMNERFDLLKSVEDLESSHRTVKQRSLDELNTCPLKIPYIYDQYVEAFNTQIDGLYEKFRTELVSRIEAKEQKFKTALTSAQSYYKEVSLVNFLFHSYYCNSSNFRKWISLWKGINSYLQKS